MEEDIFYGNISLDLKRKSESMDSDLNSVYNKFTDSIFIFPDLYKTSLEVNYLINNLNENLNEDHDYIKMDLDLKHYLKESSLNKGVKNKDYDFIEKSMVKFEPLIIRLKEYWNRARPYQYANLIEAPLFPVSTFSGHSPAYPSGHTLQGHVWAKLISTVNPELKDWAESIAVKINLSRLALGVHFPSDIDFSKKIYNELVSKKYI